jgi:hypothetical protein
MAVGYESQMVNDQLVNVAPRQAYAPLTFGAEYTGPGFWPRNGVYNVPPVVPSQAISSGQAPSQTGMSAGANPMPTAMSLSGNPFHPTKSPLWWAIGFLVVGLAMLHYIHYR